jgi:hypothetical protein
MRAWRGRRSTVRDEYIDELVEKCIRGNSAGVIAYFQEKGTAHINRRNDADVSSLLCVRV